MENVKEIHITFQEGVKIKTLEDIIDHSDQVRVTYYDESAPHVYTRGGLRSLMRKLGALKSKALKKEARHDDVAAIEAARGYRTSGILYTASTESPMVLAEKMRKEAEEKSGMKFT
jgi:hypothetical protein